MSECLLKLNRAVVGWDTPILGPIDLELHGGEILGLAGPNGVGKSTLFQAITGGARLFSGQIERRPELKLGLQTQHLPPLAGLPLCGNDLLQLTGASETGLPPWLQDLLHHRLDRLSGGQRQYLALWAVLQAPADLILLDEPTNNLDQAGTRHLVQTLQQKAASGCSLMLISHDAEFITQVCHRQLVLEENT